MLIHRHNHSGWQTTEQPSENFEEAATMAIYKACPWLRNYPHEITFKEGRYRVDYTGDPRPVALGRIQTAGFWWSEEIRLGQPDDCKKCGGTGKNHYCSWKQCWACGDKELDGVGTGKVAAEINRQLQEK